MLEGCDKVVAVTPLDYLRQTQLSLTCSSVEVNGLPNICRVGRLASVASVFLQHRLSVNLQEEDPIMFVEVSVISIYLKRPG